MDKGGENFSPIIATKTRRQVVAGILGLGVTAAATTAQIKLSEGQQKASPTTNSPTFVPVEPVIPIETKSIYPNSSNDVAINNPKEENILTPIPVENTAPKSTSVEQLPYNAPNIDLLGLETKNSKYKEEIIEAAKEFMAIGVPKQGESNRRTLLERKMFKKLEDESASASDILFALKAAGTIDGRSWGMQLLWNKRQSGALKEFGMEPLDQKRIDWAIKNNIDPRVLAMNRDCFGVVYKLLNVGRDLFFEGLTDADRKKLRIETTIPNPGAMSKLIMTETGNANPYGIEKINRQWGMVYIGGANAWDEINLAKDLFPLGHKHMEIIAKMLQDITELPYLDNVKTMPGSERGDPLLNSSGGAIGPQLI